MRNQAITAILDASLRIGEIAAAGSAQTIQRTVAKHTVEVFCVSSLVTGEIAAIPICKICMIVISHRDAPLCERNKNGSVP